MDFFKYDQLPDHLQGASRPFAELAREIEANLAPCAERTVALRKLLESKDAAVRVAVAMVAAHQASGECKPGINDLPDDQQRQLDNGEPITPHPDPGTQAVEIDEGARGPAVDRGVGHGRADDDAPAAADPDQGDAPQTAQRFDQLNQVDAQTETRTQTETHAGQGAGEIRARAEGQVESTESHAGRVAGVVHAPDAPQSEAAADGAGRPSDPPPRVDPAR